MRQYGCTRSQRKQRLGQGKVGAPDPVISARAVNDAMGRFDAGRFRAAEFSYQVDRSHCYACQTPAPHGTGRSHP